MIMTKWIFKKELGNENPVCYDIGNIERIILDRPDHNSGDKRVEKIIADGKTFYCGLEKRYFTLIYGWSTFYQLEDEQWDLDSNKITLKLNEEPKDGEEFNLDGIRRMKYRDHRYDPICSDPRVLYIMDRNYEMNHGLHPQKEARRAYMGDVSDKLWKARQKNDKTEIERLKKYIDACPIQGDFPTQSEWEHFCNDIPTKEEAIKWLLDRKYQSEPIPFEDPWGKFIYEHLFPEPNYNFLYENKTLDFLH